MSHIRDVAEAVKRSVFVGPSGTVHNTRRQHTWNPLTLEELEAIDRCITIIAPSAGQKEEFETRTSLLCTTLVDVYIQERGPVDNVDRGDEFSEYVAQVRDRFWSNALPAPFKTHLRSVTSLQLNHEQSARLEKCFAAVLRLTYQYHRPRPPK